MNNQAKAECPRVEDISAFVDGELRGPAAQEFEAHAGQCASCEPLLREFLAMRGQLQALRSIGSDVDIASLVLPQLPKPASSRRKAPLSWEGLRQLGPRALGAAGALGLGAYLGLTLLAGGGAALRPAGMTVFYGEPPGVYCAGLPACSSRGR